MKFVKNMKSNNIVIVSTPTKFFEAFELITNYNFDCSRTLCKLQCHF